MLGIVLELISIHIRPHRHPRFARTQAIWLKLTQESLAYGSITEGDTASLVINAGRKAIAFLPGRGERSEEHTSELQSLMRISYAVFCLTKKQLVILILS